MWSSFQLAVQLAGAAWAQSVSRTKHTQSAMQRAGTRARLKLLRAVSVGLSRPVPAPTGSRAPKQNQPRVRLLQPTPQNITDALEATHQDRLVVLEVHSAAHCLSCELLPMQA